MDRRVKRKDDIVLLPPGSPIARQPSPSRGRHRLVVETRPPRSVHGEIELVLARGLSPHTWVTLDRSSRYRQCFPGWSLDYRSRLSSIVLDGFVGNCEIPTDGEHDKEAGSGHLFGACRRFSRRQGFVGHEPVA